MRIEPAPVRVEFTPEFRRNVRGLAKRYRHIRSDLQPVIARLEEADFPGDRVTRTQLTIYKLRVANSDIQKGKRAGYRLIYWVRRPDFVVLVTVYSKSDQGDISPEQIRRIVREWEATANAPGTTTD